VAQQPRSFILGLIPVVGDVTNFVLGYKLVIGQADKCEIPGVLKSKMVTNQMIGAGIGFVPLVGDVFMAIYRPNSRNSHLLEKFLIERAAMRWGGCATSLVRAEPTCSPAHGAAQEQQAAATIIDRIKAWGAFDQF
jgi:hypothetical protein